MNETEHSKEFTTCMTRYYEWLNEWGKTHNNLSLFYRQSRIWPHKHSYDHVPQNKSLEHCFCIPLCTASAFKIKFARITRKWTSSEEKGRGEQPLGNDTAVTSRSWSCNIKKLCIIKSNKQQKTLIAAEVIENSAFFQISILSCAYKSILLVYSPLQNFASRP